MAYKIDPDLCASCGACESECPNNAISLKKGIYVIDPNKCKECAGVHDSPMCAQVCPNDACMPA
jgi:ferredoxin